MLQVKVHISAVEAHLVCSVVAFYRDGFLQRFSQVGADDVLVPDFGAEGGPSEVALHPSSQIYAEHVSAVEVEGILVAVAAEELEAVLCVIPEDGGLEVNAAVGLCLQGGVCLEQVLELVVEAGAVEGVGAEVLQGEACVPLKI